MTPLGLKVSMKFKAINKDDKEGDNNEDKNEDNRYIPLPNNTVISCTFINLLNLNLDSG